MRSKKGKTKNTPKAAWDNLIVARSDSLPNGVFLLFVSASRSVTSVANKKATSIGIPGGVSVLRQYPLNKTSGKRLFGEMIKSLKPFPYGDCDGFVKSSINAISRKYSELSSKDPDQIALRKLILDEEVSEQQRLLEDITKQREAVESKVRKLTGELSGLQDQKVALLKQTEELEIQRQKKVDQIDEIVDRWGEKGRLEEEIEELENRIQELRSEHAAESEVAVEG